MILPECNLQQALARAEQIRVRLRDCPIEYAGVTQRRITVSIGVATLDETTDRVDRLLTCADEALRSKETRAGPRCRRSVRYRRPTRRGELGRFRVLVTAVRT